MAASGSLTGQHLSTRTVIKSTVREPTGALAVSDARHHNLRGVSVKIPTGVMTVVAGVAGSGKSSLVGGAFLAQHPAAVLVDQSPPKANKRSTTLTFTGVADAVRTEFAKANGVAPALFSANSTGACGNCAGLGVVTTDLASFDAVAQVCQTCDGRRFTDEVLRYRLRGRGISDVLEMTVADGQEFFKANKKVAKVLTAVADVGLDYLRLGQPLTTFSGGECQRVKLAPQLHTRGATYVLDEPTTGLHMADVGRLLGVLDRLVDAYGSTVIVIEHNLEVIGHADWVVELGPEGGRHGGQVVFEGTAAELALAGTATGEHLRRSAQ
ncbi:ATP-binding cassette domain-containing protein [Actinokineospora sp. G85]|uniref:ATP-binding cassette domain-containing protein n=1 Tax=Actinokineospora sp. G85 TaxID=3406626 RepID=UPI003C757952